MLPCYVGSYVINGIFIRGADAYLTLDKNGTGKYFHPTVPNFSNMEHTVTFNYKVEGDSLAYKLTSYVSQVVGEAPRTFTEFDVWSNTIFGPIYRLEAKVGLTCNSSGVEFSAMQVLYKRK